MLAVVRPHTLEQRKLVIRAEVQLERAYARKLVVVHTLRILTVELAARLPVAFEERPRRITRRHELCHSGGCEPGQRPDRQPRDRSPCECTCHQGTSTVRGGSK